MGRYSDLVISDGGANLLGYWTLDAEFGLTDKSSGAHNGTGQGGVTVGTATGPGQLTATDLDGVDDRVTMAFNPFVHGSTRTYECWAKRDTNNTNDTLMSSAATAHCAAPLTFLSGGNTAVVSSGDHDTSAYSVAATGVWAHYMIVQNDSAQTVQPYLNGVGLGAKSVDLLGDTSPAFEVGAIFATSVPPTNYFDGKICHVAIYSGDRSSLALSHYTAGRAFAETPTGALSLSGTDTDAHSVAVSPSGSLTSSGAVADALSTATAPSGSLTLDGTAVDSEGIADSMSGTLALTLHMREAVVTYHPGAATYGGTPGATYGGGTTSTYGGGTADTYSLSRSSSYDQEY